MVDVPVCAPHCPEVIRLRRERDAALELVELRSKERDAALALAFERGRGQALAIAERSELRRALGEALDDIGLLRGEAGRLAAERERLRRAIAESAAPLKAVFADGPVS
jgi:hypothetical protein